MLVGQATVDESKLNMHIKTYEDFIEYSDSLVPESYRHRLDICMNQRYLCAMLIRKNKSIDWSRKKDLINRIMSETSVTGFTSSIIDVSVLESFIDDKMMIKYDRRNTDI